MPAEVGKDIPWETIPGLCRVTHFLSMSTVKGKKVKAWSATQPYGLLSIEAPFLPTDDYLVRLAHQQEFLCAHAIFEERGVTDQEEVLFLHLEPTRVSAKMVSKFMPKLYFYIYPKGTLENLYNPDGSESQSNVSLASLAPLAKYYPKGWERLQN